MSKPTCWDDYPEHTRQRADALFSYILELKPVLEQRKRERERREQSVDGSAR